MTTSPHETVYYNISAAWFETKVFFCQPISIPYFHQAHSLYVPWHHFAYCLYECGANRGFCGIHHSLLQLTKGQLELSRRKQAFKEGLLLQASEMNICTF